LPTGGEVADAAVYPVPDQLHPAVATPRLPGRGGGEILGFDLVRVAAQVTAGAGHMATTAGQAAAGRPLAGRGGGGAWARVAAQVTAGTGHMTTTADQARQVRLLLERGGVDDRSRVTDQQHPGIAVDEGLLPRLREGGTTSPVGDAQVAVEVGEAGDHVSAELEDLGSARQLGPLVADDPAHDPGLGELLLGAQQDRSAQVEDRSGSVGDHAGEPIEPPSHQLSGPSVRPGPAAP